MVGSLAVPQLVLAGTKSVSQPRSALAAYPYADVRAAAQVDALNRIVWVARSYAFLVIPLLLIILAVAHLAAADDREGTRYRASALVVAAQTDLHRSELPRLGQAVFAGPLVSARVHSRLGVTDDPPLIPRHISMDPVPRSVVFHVEARAGDPGSAVAMANVAADVFVEEINRAARGAGTFLVQVRAEEPTARAQEAVAAPLRVLMTMTTAGILAIGGLALLTHVRRPLLMPAEASGVVGAPVLATFDLQSPMFKGHLRDLTPGPPADDRRINALVRTLARIDADTIVLEGNRASVDQRRALADVLTSATGPAGISIVADKAPNGRRAPVTLVVIREGTPAHQVTASLNASSRKVVGVVFLHQRAPGRPNSANRLGRKVFWLTSPLRREKASPSIGLPR